MPPSEINKCGIITTGVWLRTDGDWLEVLVEAEGVWRVAIRTYAPLKEQTISYITRPLGIIDAPIWNAEGV